MLSENCDGPRNSYDFDEFCLRSVLLFSEASEVEASFINRPSLSASKNEFMKGVGFDPKSDMGRF